MGGVIGAQHHRLLTLIGLAALVLARMVDVAGEAVGPFNLGHVWPARHAGSQHQLAGLEDDGLGGPVFLGSLDGHGPLLGRLVIDR